MQASTPITVEAEAAQKAIETVLPSASMIWRLANISSYHSREKPTQAFIVLPPLKDSTMSVKIGR